MSLKKLLRSAVCHVSFTDVSGGWWGFWLVENGLKQHGGGTSMLQSQQNNCKMKDVKEVTHMMGGGGGGGGGDTSLVEISTM